MKENDLNPIENRFLDFIAKMGTRLAALERGRQDIQGDWQEFNVSSFTYNASNVINVDTQLSVSDFFQVGDKVRITQTTVKYFYVIKVDTTNNRITLNAGTDYTYINAAITAFGISRLASPLGHPGRFAYTPTISKTGGTGFSTVLNSAIYKLDGNLITLFHNASFAYSSMPSIITATLPFHIGPVGIDINIAVIGIGGTGIFPQRGTILNGDDVISYIDDSFGSTSWDVYTTIVYPYIPE